MLSFTLTVELLTVELAFGSTTTRVEVAASCSPRAAIWSYIFCGRSTTQRVCVAGTAAFVFATEFTAPLLETEAGAQPNANKIKPNDPNKSPFDINSSLLRNQHRRSDRLATNDRAVKHIREIRDNAILDLFHRHFAAQDSIHRR